VIAWLVFSVAFTGGVFMGVWIGLRVWRCEALLLSAEELDMVCRALQAYRKLYGSRIGLVEDVYHSLLRARDPKQVTGKRQHAANLPVP